MNRATAISIIARNLSPNNELVFSREDAVELHRIASEALVEFPEDEHEDEAYLGVALNKRNFAELIEAYDVMGELPYKKVSTLPLVIALSELVHPEGGIICTPIEQGFGAIVNSGKWPEQALPPEKTLPDVIRQLSQRLTNIKNGEPLTAMDMTGMVVVIGRPADDPKIKHYLSCPYVDDDYIYAMLLMPGGFLVPITEAI